MEYMEKTDKGSIFAPTEFWRIMIVAIILASGFITRMFDLTDPPLDYAAARQLRSAMIARGKYYSTLDDVPEWQLDIAQKQQNIHGMIEPEIIENITVATYRIIGEEKVWIARIYSSLFWVLGGLALYSLTRFMVSDDGSVIALIYYLFAPFGLVASRTFQPDPLMTAMIITAWMSFFHWYRTSSWKWAILAGITAGAAMYIKSTSVFFLLFGMAVVVLSRKKILDTIKDFQVWVIVLLSGIPALSYTIYGIFISGELESQLKGRFFPQMWTDPDFYLQWKNAISNVTGHYLILIIGLVGLFLIKQKRDRFFLLFIWVGYLLYGFGFSYHISTHYYYTLPVIPLLAVSLGEIADRLIMWFKKTKLTSLVLVGTSLMVIAGMAGGYYILVRKDFRHEPPYYQKVANFVEPEAKIVALSQDYGYRLSYFGWRVVYPWKGKEDLRYIELRDSTVDPFSERFSEFTTDYDYFIITRMSEFRRQEALFNELNEHYPIVEEGGGYMIFDLRERQD
jgi:hypothetical protein